MSGGTSGKPGLSRISKSADSGVKPGGSANEGNTTHVILASSDIVYGCPEVCRKSISGCGNAMMRTSPLSSTLTWVNQAGGSKEAGAVVQGDHFVVENLPVGSTRYH